MVTGQILYLGTRVKDWNGPHIKKTNQLTSKKVMADVHVMDYRHQLQSNEANIIRLKPESDSNHSAFHQSAQEHMVVRSKACGGKR